MFRLLADESLNDDIVRGLLLREPDFDIVRVQDVGLQGAGDPEILAWAADNNRVTLIYDRATMPDFAFDRVTARETMTGVFVVNDRLPVGQAIQENYSWSNAANRPNGTAA